MFVKIPKSWLTDNGRLNLYTLKPVIFLTIRSLTATAIFSPENQLLFSGSFGNNKDTNETVK